MAAAVAAPPVAFDFKSLECSGGRLNETLAEHENRIFLWRRAISQKIVQNGQRIMNELNQERRGLDDLAAEITESSNLIDDVAATRDCGNHVRKLVREGNNNMDGRSQVAAKARDRFVDLERELSEECCAEERALAEHRASAVRDFADVDAFLGMHERRLGLAFARAGPRMLRVKFVLIDRCDLDREFTFVLGLKNEGGGYRLSGCDPQLPPQRLNLLLNRLNNELPSETSALSAFLCGMRKAFQDLAATS